MRMNFSGRREPMRVGNVRLRGQTVLELSKRSPEIEEAVIMEQNYLHQRSDCLRSPQ